MTQDAASFAEPRCAATPHGHARLRRHAQAIRVCPGWASESLRGEHLTCCVYRMRLLDFAQLASAAYSSRAPHDPPTTAGHSFTGPREHKRRHRGIRDS